MRGRLGAFLRGPERNKICERRKNKQRRNQIQIFQRRKRGKNIVTERPRFLFLPVDSLASRRERMMGRRCCRTKIARCGWREKGATANERNGRERKTGSGEGGGEVNEGIKWE